MKLQRGTLEGALHDIVMQLLPEPDMLSVSYTPGNPYLVPGKAPAVKGIGAGGLSYSESCGSVQQTATWSPLSSENLPLPGTTSTMEVSAALHNRGNLLQKANNNAAVPILIARNTSPNTVGLYIEPDQWRSAGYYTRSLRGNHYEDGLQRGGY